MKSDDEVLYTLRANEKPGRERDWGEIAQLVEAESGQLVAVERMVTAKKKDFLLVGKNRWPDVDRIEEFTIDEAKGHVAARVKDGKKCAVILDGKKGEPFDDILEVVFSAQGDLAYAGGVKKKGTTIVRGTTTYGPYEAAGNIAVSPDGKHLAWIVAEGGKRGKYGTMAGGKWFVMVDGEKRTEAFDHVTVVSWSPNGKLGFVANVGGETDGVYDASGGEWFAIVDGVKGPPFAHINRVVGLRWSSDGRVAYLADVGKNREAAVFEGVASPPDKNIQHVTWWNDKPFYATSTACVVDGVPTEPCGAVGPISFSNKRFAYMADFGRKRHAIVDGKKGPAFSQDLNTSAVFSPDGSRVAYMVNDGGKCFIYVDDQKVGAEWDNLAFAMAFSPDGKRFAYSVIDKEKQRWVVDGVAGPPADDVSELVFGDGGHYAYASISGKGKKRTATLTIDDAPAGTFDEVRNLVWAMRSKCFAAMAAKGNDRILVRRSL